MSLKIRGVSRLTDDSHVLMLHFDRRPTDDDLREIHDKDATIDRLTRELEHMTGQRGTELVGALQACMENTALIRITAERDRLRTERDQLAFDHGHTLCKLETALAERERLRAALQWMLDGKGTRSAAQCLDKAREALREEK